MEKMKKKTSISILLTFCITLAVVACVFIYKQVNNLLLEKKIDTPQAPIQTEAAGGTISMPSEEPTTEEKTEAPTETTTKAPAKEPTTKKQTPSNNTGGGSLEAKIKKLNGKGKKIYLTFDDGPSKLTPQILDILDKYNVKATFFVIGNGTNHSYLSKIAEKGHAIGLHTYSHNYKYIYASEENFFDDLEKISKLVEQETGVVSKIIRFPGGSSNLSSKFNPGVMSRLAEKVKAKGYEYYDWNCTNGDGTGNNLSVSTLINTAVDTALKANGDLIMLMHDSAAKKTTVEALPRIIEIFRDAGYTFAPISPETVPVHHTIKN
ncbi:MAG: polysaccharide deacetylase [Clostridiales bacterium]|jgi:peptidoglycan/xylan/chitin deacetylase (PgdA/CDA1 family)|nr:polysaccharide deacetylase [Clostridiales bacterium]HOJ36219.1 polysaccharide deacetylase family protein [Clostridiales bacterium]HQA05477.1 polysaccharide deacetylase family protein [Clostridiales bacterium]